MPKPIGPRARILECRTQNECRVNAPLNNHVKLDEPRASTRSPYCETSQGGFPARFRFLGRSMSFIPDGPGMDPCLYHLSNGNFVRGHKFFKLANFIRHSHGVGAYRTFLETQTVVHRIQIPSPSI